MPVQDDWDGYGDWRDSNSESQRMMRKYPIWPLTGIPPQWIDRSDPNYEESIFQGELGGLDVTGMASTIGNVGPRAKWWWSQLDKALESNQLKEAKKIKGQTLLNMFRKLGVNTEELRWTGIKDLAEEAYQEPVSMDLVRELARTNKIDITDYNLRDNPEYPAKLKKLRDFYYDSVSQRKHALRHYQYEAEEYTPEDFKAFLQKQPIRMDATDKELAKEMGMGRIEYKQWRDRYLAKSQENLKKDQLISYKLQDAMSKIRQKYKARHEYYVMDKPLRKGENYQEMLVRLNRPGQDVRSGGAHYGVSNTLVGVLADNRMTMEGLKALHIHEYQADWAQAARRYGIYRRMPTELKTQYEELTKQRDILGERFWDKQRKIDQARKKYYDVRNARVEQGLSVTSPEISALREKYTGLLDESNKVYRQQEDIEKTIREIEKKYMKKHGQQPDLPFQNTESLKLGLKKALHEAARQDVDALTWIKGDLLHKHRVGNRSSQTWPYTIYDEFTPKTIKSLLKEIGIEAEVKKMRYPGNTKTTIDKGRRYDELNAVYEDIVQRLDDIEIDAAYDDLDPAGHPDWENLTQLRDQAYEELQKHMKVHMEDKGWEVWGIELSPKAKQTILKKGFKISQLQDIAKEMLG